jgi:toxin YhaV
MFIVKGWAIYAHPLFLDQLKRLVEPVEAGAAKDAIGYRNGANAKLLASVLKLSQDVIPSDPASRAYLLGNTLGKDYRHWRRAKFGGGRFRLFFWYVATPPTIIYAWVNDENSLRTFGSKSDAYRVFKKMLGTGNPPNKWDELFAACSNQSGPLKRLLGLGRGLFDR